MLILSLFSCCFYLVLTRLEEESDFNSVLFYPICYFWILFDVGMMTHVISLIEIDLGSCFSTPLSPASLLSTSLTMDPLKRSKCLRQTDTIDHNGAYFLFFRETELISPIFPPISKLIVKIECGLLWQNT